MNGTAPRYWARIFRTIVALAGALLALPAGATSLFTIDGNGDGAIQTKKGVDEVDFSFMGSLGVASGSLRPVDLSNTTAADLEAQVAGYADFSGGSIMLDFDTMDVLVFDVVLDANSAPVDSLGVAVATDPIDDPDGAGYLSGRGQAPDSVGLEPGVVGVLPGAVVYTYDPDYLDSRGRTSRLFVAWSSDGVETGQTAVFMISSGINASFAALLSDVLDSGGSGGGGGCKGRGRGCSSALQGSASESPVPEPGTVLLLGSGLAGMALAARGRTLR